MMAASTVSVYGPRPRRDSTLQSSDCKTDDRSDVLTAAVTFTDSGYGSTFTKYSGLQSADRERIGHDSTFVALVHFIGSGYGSTLFKHHVPQSSDSKERKNNEKTLSALDPKCFICGIDCQNMGDCFRHETECLATCVDKGPTCISCNITFADLQSLQMHQNAEHGRRQDSSNRSAERDQGPHIWSLQLHQTSENGRPQASSNPFGRCGQDASSTQSSLTQARDRLDGDGASQTYTCSECAFFSESRFSYLTHEGTHTRYDEVQNVDSWLDHDPPWNSLGRASVGVGMHGKFQGAAKGNTTPPPLRISSLLKSEGTLEGIIDSISGIGHSSTSSTRSSRKEHAYHRCHESDFASFTSASCTVNTRCDSLFFITFESGFPEPRIRSFFGVDKVESHDVSLDFTDHSESQSQYHNRGLVPRSVLEEFFEKIIARFVPAYQEFRSHGAMGGSDPASHSVQDSTRVANKATSHKRKRNGQGGHKKRDQGDQGDDDDPNLQADARRSSKEAGKFFACPFLKKDPWRHRTCLGHQFHTVARMKYHLQRCKHHKLPLYCPRCSDTFETEALRDAHIRLGGCPEREERKWDGITEMQRELLKKKSSSKDSEEEQWYAVWRILFLDEPLPSDPYVNSYLLNPLNAFLEYVRSEGPGIYIELISERLQQPPSSSPEGWPVLHHRIFLDLLERLQERYSFASRTEGGGLRPQQAHTDDENRASNDRVKKRPRDSTLGSSIAESSSRGHAYGSLHYAPPSSLPTIESSDLETHNLVPPLGRDSHAPVEEGLEYVGDVSNGASQSFLDQLPFSEYSEYSTDMLVEGAQMGGLEPSTFTDSLHQQEPDVGPIFEATSSEIFRQGNGEYQ